MIVPNDTNKIYSNSSFAEFLGRQKDNVPSPKREELHTALVYSQTYTHSRQRPSSITSNRIQAELDSMQLESYSTMKYYIYRRTFYPMVEAKELPPQTCKQRNGTRHCNLDGGAVMIPLVILTFKTKLTTADTGVIKM
jgi:hypothetical protein